MSRLSDGQPQHICNQFAADVTHISYNKKLAKQIHAHCTRVVALEMRRSLMVRTHCVTGSNLDILPKDIIEVGILFVQCTCAIYQGALQSLRYCK